MYKNAFTNHLSNEIFICISNYISDYQPVFTVTGIVCDRGITKLKPGNKKETNKFCLTLCTRSYYSKSITLIIFMSASSKCVPYLQ